MNTIKLNTIGDSPVVVKKGSQVQSQEKTVEIIENGTTEVVPDSGYALSKVTVNTNVESSGSATKWTGHADAEGLKAIGWTNEDIAYYQANGVNWNEEDDEYHKVTDDNKALYGVLTADNISTYKDRIVYLPKIDTSGKTSMRNMFQNCFQLRGLPMLETSKVTDMYYAFYGCLNLCCIPPLDTSSVTSMMSAFGNCRNLLNIPLLNTTKVNNMNGMFTGCSSLLNIPKFDTSRVTNIRDMVKGCYVLHELPEFNMELVTLAVEMFSSCYNLKKLPKINAINIGSYRDFLYNCYSLISIPQLDITNATDINNLLETCLSLVEVKLKGLKMDLSIRQSPLLSKDSLLYIINNEAATSAITITLAAYAYTRLAEDADVVAALANHPNISLASA